MKFSITLAVALFHAVFVNAQYSSSAQPVTTAPAPSPSMSRSSSASASASASSSSSAPPAPTIPPSNSTNVNVQVAPGGRLMFSPANFAAKNGTIVTFYFPTTATPHSVTQGYFSKPCAYLAASGGNPEGFDSGLQSGKQYALRITNDQLPIYFFCKAVSHCGLGMVGAINAPATGNTYAAYLAGAQALGTSEPVISGTGPMPGGVGATPVSSPVVSSSATTSSRSTSSTSAPGPSTTRGLSPISAPGPMTTSTRYLA